MEDLGKGTLAVGISPFGDKSEMLEDLREMLQEQLTDAIATGRTLLSHVETPLFPFEDGTPDDVSYRAEVIEELVNELRSARLEIDSLIDQKHSEDDSLENIQTKPKEKGTITEISLIDTKLNVDVPKKHLVTGGVIHVNVRDINASDWQPVVEEFVKEADEVREVNTMPDFDFLMNGVMEDETYQKQSVVSSEEMEDGVFDQSNRTDNKTEVDVISRADQVSTMYVCFMSI